MKTNSGIPHGLPFTGILAVCASMLVGGCLIMGNHQQTESGTKVSEETMSRIKPNETTEEWVRATLGPPTSDTSLKDGGRIMKWTYTERHESSGAVFLIFGGHDEKRVTHTAYVELHNGVVTNAWRE